MAAIIKDEELTRISTNLKPDKKKRIVLPGSLVREDITYHIYSNSLGQIVLDPQVTIPASEAWLFNNPVAIASVRRGLSDAARGRVSRIDLNTL